MNECSICGQQHEEGQTWLYGSGYKHRKAKDGGHFEKGVWISPVKAYEDVQYGKLVICRNCENITRLLFEVEKKRSIAFSLIVMLCVPLLLGFFFYLKHSFNPGLMISFLSCLGIFFLSFGRLPPKAYPIFDKTEPIDLKDPLTPLDNMVRIVRINMDLHEYFIWKSDIQDIIKGQASNPKPAVRAAEKFDDKRYQYLLCMANKWLGKGRIYKAIIHTVLFKNRLPTPETMMVIGYILERIGRIREALCAYRMSARISKDGIKPENEAKRLIDHNGGLPLKIRPMDLGLQAVSMPYREKIRKKVRQWMSNPTHVSSIKAVKHLWHLLLLNDAEGLELYARVMEALNQHDAAKRARDSLAEMEISFRCHAV